MAVDLKGNSSYSHPGNKKSFKIDSNDDIAGQKYHGMSKVHFNNCWSDPTFLREKIFFDYCKDHGVLAPRVLYANVTMNGTFWGFYNMRDQTHRQGQPGLSPTIRPSGLPALPANRRRS